MPRLKPTTKERSDRIGLKVKPEFGERLRQFCVDEKLTLTEVVETAVGEYLAAREAPKKLQKKGGPGAQTA